MIDIHLSLLPNIRKGPNVAETFLEMSKTLIDHGVTAVAATPFYDGQDPEFEKHNIITYVEAANETLQRASLPLQIVPGQRALIHPNLYRSYENNHLLTINENSKYMLLQIPTDDFSSYIEYVTYQLQLSGVIPIISEPECHFHFVANPDRLYRLVKRGVIVQLSSSSIVGENGRKAKKAALTFLTNGLAHVIASGAHAGNYRSYSLRKAYDVLKKQYSSQVMYMLMENAEAIINGQSVYKDPPERVKKEKFLRIF
ncbi:tyrosine protein phosphatase [Priestia megaterium]|nr:tyrosine protein phosphatase [Priestia megaterium]